MVLGFLGSGVSYTTDSDLGGPSVSLLCLQVGTGLDWVLHNDHNMNRC